MTSATAQANRDKLGGLVGGDALLQEDREINVLFGVVATASALLLPRRRQHRRADGHRQGPDHGAAPGPLRARSKRAAAATHRLFLTANGGDAAKRQITVYLYSTCEFIQ
ncbi:hypothetical protein BN2497_3079 [Janthinobacterium sp. CG23_2]|nr:hypothetical protein BN2497_3079 [Janthinobacterium sp. CG23_2]CUU27937.1 hypothetical protein BN3177_3079 [Janthinobacterium sp. CG23_2]